MLAGVSKHSSTEVPLTVKLMGNFPSRFPPSPHPYIYKSSSYLLLQWREAFLSDLLSFVEFLPSPAWTSPVCWKQEKNSNSSFYGVYASQELGFLLISSPNFPEAQECSDWSGASIQGIDSGFYIKRVENGAPSHDPLTQIENSPFLYIFISAKHFLD